MLENAIGRVIETELVVAFRIVGEELARHLGFAPAVAMTKAANFVDGWAAEHAWRRMLGDCQ